MARHSKANWNLPDPPQDWEQAQVALLMDLRDELREIKEAVKPLRHLDCLNFQAIPGKLERIARNTAKPKRKKRAAKGEA